MLHNGSDNSSGMWGTYLNKGLTRICSDTMHISGDNRPTVWKKLITGRCSSTAVSVNLYMLLHNVVYKLTLCVDHCRLRVRQRHWTANGNDNTATEQQKRIVETGHKIHAGATVTVGFSDLGYCFRLGSNALLQRNNFWQWLKIRSTLWSRTVQNRAIDKRVIYLIFVTVARVIIRPTTQVRHFSLRKVLFMV